MKSETIVYRALGEAQQRLINPPTLLKLSMKGYDLLIDVSHQLQKVRQSHFNRMMEAGCYEL